MTEVERAIDNLAKTGKIFPGPRRESVGAGRGFADFGKYHSHGSSTRNG